MSPERSPHGPNDGPTLTFDGVLVLGSDDPRDGNEDDGCLLPALGLAVVARGIGAIGNQGRPASKLVVWSVIGELTHGTGTLEERLREGLSRAEDAVARLTANWPKGLMRCGATLAVVLLDGRTALVAHLGDCGVGLFAGGRIVPLTRPHTLGAEEPAIPADMARIPTRMVGRGSVAEVQRIAVRPGDVLLLSSGAWPHEHGLPAGVEALAAIAAREGCTVIAARVVERTTRPPAHRSVYPPAPSWLYRPGAPLDDPPTRYALGTPGHGPDSQWFREVYSGVMNKDVR